MRIEELSCELDSLRFGCMGHIDEEEGHIFLLIEK
jgi:hypothetical protein